MAPKGKYKKGDRVKCLATRFDTDDNKDAQGRKWSEVYMAKEKTKWCRGTIQSLVGGRRFAGNYKVKYDGDSAALTSNEVCPLALLSRSFPGKCVQKDGKDKGKIKTKVDRCTMCQKRNHRPDHGRAPRTSYIHGRTRRFSFVLPMKALASRNTRTSIQAVPTTQWASSVSIAPPVAPKTSSKFGCAEEKGGAALH